jgi:hypothetical protein
MIATPHEWLLSNGLLVNVYIEASLRNAAAYDTFAILPSTIFTVANHLRS